ncbi:MULTISPECIES: hypothetical protein [unclassified Streptomyces]|uniref:hypothetical protein n=1 Tax=unclassified Streptomyces TaxID=2593676 RepID=UPI00278C10BD|nr:MULTISPECIES: hypothetical protein [unclassified Streptomyces]
MPSAVVHAFDQAWPSSNPGLLEPSVSDLRKQGTGSLLLVARPGAAGASVSYAPSTPLDLSAFDELRLWTYASRTADGTSRAPFLLELSYLDAADTPGEEHRWLVPVNRRDTWEQHRFGIGGDRRARITDLSLRCLTDEPFRMNLDELLAVDDAPLSDVESALTGLLDRLPLPGVVALPVPATPAGSDTLVVGLNRRLYVGNRITVDGTDTHYAVTAAVHDAAAATTTLTIRPPLLAAIGPGASISVTAPVVVDEDRIHGAAEAGDLPDPALLISLTDQREELERAWTVPQRDSFRVRDELTVCSLRPAPRPVLVEYRIQPAASDRGHALALRTEVVDRIGTGTGLRVNGAVLPVRTVPPPALLFRSRPVPAPVCLCVGTRIEQGRRTEVPWVRQGTVISGPLTAPWDPAGAEPPPVPGPDDQEGIVLRT